MRGFILLNIILTFLSFAVAADKRDVTPGPMPRPKPDRSPKGQLVLQGNVNAYNKNRIASKNLTCTIKAGPTKGINASIQATEQTSNGGYRLLVQINDKNAGCPAGTNVWIYYGKNTRNFITLKGDQRKDKPKNINADKVKIDEKGDTASTDDAITHATFAHIPTSGENLTQAEIVLNADGKPPVKNSKINLQPSVDEIAAEYHEKENPSKGFDQKKAKKKRGEPSQNTVTNALDKIQSSDSNCANCQQSVPQPKYETCTEANNYLEGRIPSLDDLLQNIGSSENSAQADPNLRFAASVDFQNCISRSMTNFPNKGVRYGACNDKNSKIEDSSRIQTKFTNKKPITRPCASQRNVESVATVFEIASACLNVNKNEVFALVNHESGFNANAVSATNCAGFGQLCGGSSNAIAEINQTHFENALSELRSGKPECQALAKRINEKMSTNPALSCERISKTDEFGNWSYDPTRNIVYTLLYYRQNKSAAQSKLEKNKNFNAIKDENLKNDILTTITYLQHNAGPGTIKTLAANFFKNPKTNKFSDFESFYNAFNNYVKNNSEGRWPASKTREVKEYLSKIRNDLKKISNSNCSSWPSS